jgi:uncharacterized protein YuzE
MRLTYDPRYNPAYIRLREKQTDDAEAIRTNDEVVVDIAPDGTLYGTELLNANEQLRHAEAGELVVISEATGERTSLPLSGMPAA